MSWGFIAVAVGTIIVGAVASHDVDVKKNRAIGAIEEQARSEREALESDQASLQAGLDADKEKRRQNIERINPTGAGGLDEDSPLRRQATERNVTQQTSASRGRGRLLGS